MTEFDQTILGDCRQTMARLIDEGVHVQCVVTSPPFYGLRSYSAGTWDGGGDPTCDHRGRNPRQDHIGDPQRLRRRGTRAAAVAGSTPTRSRCARCGATRRDPEMGLEDSLDDYLDGMVHVFRQVRDLMRDDATAWVHIGDSHVKKHLLMVPARLAIALSSDGWVLRQDVIIHKRNAMPLSVRDRPSSSHDHILMLAKRTRYLYNAKAVAEPRITQENSLPSGWTDRASTNHSAIAHSIARANGRAKTSHRNPAPQSPMRTRNRRSVWTISTEPAGRFGHFATFPRSIVEPCILAGSNRGDLIFDPFMGSGTVARVAIENGRHWLGCELNPDYLKIQAKRTERLQRRLF